MSDVPIEENQILSRSRLWALQRRFFEEARLRAWSEGIVPHYITSNPFLAHSYRRLVEAYLRDLGPDLDEGEPVHIVELGAGSGRFGYQLLKLLRGTGDGVRRPAIRYVMTDLSEERAEDLRRLPALRPLADEGLLDFACFDAEHPGPLRLLESGQTLGPGSLRNPLLVVANYFFDGIPQDVFRITDGQAQPGRVTLTAPDAAPDADAAALLAQLRIEYAFGPADGPAYEEIFLEEILAEYRESLDATCLAFPCTALRCLDALAQVSGRGLLLLTADKGYAHAEALLDRGVPEVAIHGSISMSVNYHALGRYFRRQGGTVLHTRRRRSNLRICAMALGSPPGDLPATAKAFDETVELQGPDDFFLIKKGLENAVDALSVDEILAFLRFSGWDAMLFWRLSARLMALAPEIEESLRPEIAMAARQIWNLYLPIGEERDLAFQLALLLAAIDYFPEALEFFAYSLHAYGPDARTFYNIAVCHSRLRQVRPALEAVQTALEMEPDYPDARALRIRLHGILEQGLG
jgi:tetratricopeptide (TPR) repeat protein